MERRGIEYSPDLPSTTSNQRIKIYQSRGLRLAALGEDNFPLLACYPRFSQHNRLVTLISAGLLK